MSTRKRWIAQVAAVVLGITNSSWGQQPSSLPVRPATLGTPAEQGDYIVVTQDKKPANPEPPKTVAEMPRTEVLDSTGGVLRGCDLGCSSERCAGWGPTMPENVKTFRPLFPDCTGRGIDIYGWGDFGYTYSSTGGGALAVQPRENRFGNEFLVNQLAIVMEKKLKSGEFNVGFKATFYAGADPALIQPLGGFTTTNPRFGADFRELYVSAHLPIITEGGLDLKFGRMGTVIGYNSALAPYRPFYSSDYQWFYAQDGAFTGLMGTLHVNKQLDVIGAITQGANTFFNYRGNGPCYLGQVNYWTSEEKRTLLSASTYIGNQALFTAGPQFVGSNDYMLELRIQHDWNKCLTQIVQSDMVWATNVPGGLGTTEFYSLYSIWSYHATKQVDVNFRAEWVRDVQGSRTGVSATYAETTFGIDFHPTKNLRLRPEIRGDFADRPAFNGGNRSQLTIGFDALFSF